MGKQQTSRVMNEQQEDAAKSVQRKQREVKNKL